MDYNSIGQFSGRFESVWFADLLVFFFLYSKITILSLKKDKKRVTGWRGPQ